MTAMVGGWEAMPHTSNTLSYGWSLWSLWLWRVLPDSSIDSFYFETVTFVAAPMAATDALCSGERAFVLLWAAASLVTCSVFVRALVVVALTQGL